MSTTALRRFLRSETEWNPKVMLGRVALRILPEGWMNLVKKHYYAYLISHRREEDMEQDVMVCRKLFGPGDNVVDVGANLGSFSRFMAKRAARVFAFEPIPQIYEFLTHNMRKLQLANVECVPVALSDRNEKQAMVIPTYRWGQECWYDARIKAPQSDPRWREFQIESRTLDSLSLPRISFIKCDAEYHELSVLRGALTTIRRDHPAMLIEVNPDPDDPTTSAFQTFELLRKEGYEVYWFDGKNLRLRKPGDRSQNYFFLMPEQTKKAAA